MDLYVRLFVVFCCIYFVSGLLKSERTYESFAPHVPSVFMADVVEGSNTLQSFVPTLKSSSLSDTHLVALNLAEQILGFNATYISKNSYVSSHNNVRHVYLRQVADDGKEIFNADLSINVKDNKIITVGHSFFRGSTSSITGHLTSIDAVAIFAAFMKMDIPDATDLKFLSSPKGIDRAHSIGGIPGAVTHANMKNGYMIVDNGNRIEPVWEIELDMNLHWWNAYVSSITGEVIAVYDWVHDLNSFNIYPIGVNDPSDGERAFVFNPAVEPASPDGWNNQGNGTITTTIGNNVYAQSNPNGTAEGWLYNPRPPGGADNDYNYPIDFTKQPVTYLNASCTNLFAWNNYIHDIFYGYGFNESAGNFQENNYGRGGKGGDAVQANCQDGAGLNNANFATPVDGLRPRMRMYVWNASVPMRDGDLDVGIIVHEYAHGITTRLTGGPANSNCLALGEAGGMGEGWGDFFANVIRQRETYTRETVFPMGDYSANKTAGIRKYPYTTNMTIDPETYAYINGAAYTGVHAKGEVWCGILWEVYWNFVDAYGFTPDLYDGVGGNTMILQNVVDGLKLQPCNPNFVAARDAIIKADAANYGGSNYCLLWKGFAKRGLGLNAKGGTLTAPTVKEDFSYPPEC